MEADKRNELIEVIKSEAVWFIQHEQRTDSPEIKQLNKDLGVATDPAAGARDLKRLRRRYGV